MENQTSPPCLSSPYEGFEPVKTNLIARDIFIPGELYFSSEDWTLFRESSLESRDLSIPAFSPFMFIGEIENKSTRIGEAKSIFVVLYKESYAYYNFSHIISSIIDSETTLYNTTLYKAKKPT